MPIKVTCSNCAGVLHAPDDAAGKRGRCPSCGTVLTIPTNGGSSAPVPPPAAASEPPPRPIPQPQSAMGFRPPVNPGISESDLGMREPMPSGLTPSGIPEPRRPNLPPAALGSKVPPDPRKYSTTDPFSKPAASDPKQASKTTTGWKRVKGGLGWIQAAIFFTFLAVVGAAGLPIALDNGLKLPDAPALTKIEGINQATEIQIAAVVAPLILAMLCLVFGRMSVASAPRESYGRGLANLSSLATLLVLVGVTVTAGVTAIGLQGFIPKALPPATEPVNIQQRIQYLASQYLLQWDEVAGLAQRFGITAILVFGLVSEIWFVAALGRFGAALQNARAAGRVNRFIIYVGLVTIVGTFLAVAYDLFGVKNIAGDPVGQWNALDIKIKTMAVGGGCIFIALLVAIAYWRMLGGVKGAIREYLDSVA